jgi:fructoselysine-6-P-deglycase FrlB-like protein
VSGSAGSLLEREIREQPDAVRAALERNAAPIAHVAERLLGRGPLEQVVVGARGTRTTPPATPRT